MSNKFNPEAVAQRIAETDHDANYCFNPAPGATAKAGQHTCRIYESALREINAVQAAILDIEPTKDPKLLAAWLENSRPRVIELSDLLDPQGRYFEETGNSSLYGHLAWGVRRLLNSRDEDLIAQRDTACALADKLQNELDNLREDLAEARAAALADLREINDKKDDR